MKKIVAVLLSIVMMLSFTAYATTFDIGLQSLTIVESGTVVTELTDPGLRIGVAQDDNDGSLGLRLAMEAEGTTIVEAIATLTSEKIMASVTGISDIYSVDLETAAILLVELGSSIGMDGIELSEADSAIVGEMSATVINALTTGAYTSEDGNTIGAIIGKEDIATLIGQCIALAQNHPELLALAEITSEDLDGFVMPESLDASINAYVTVTDASSIACLVLNFAEGDDTLAVTLSGETDRNGMLSLVFSVNEDGEVSSMTIVLNVSEADDTWLIPADATTIDAFSMDDAQFEKLSGELEGLLGAFGF